MAVGVQGIAAAVVLHFLGAAEHNTLWDANLHNSAPVEHILVVYMQSLAEFELEAVLHLGLDVSLLLEHNSWDRKHSLGRNTLQQMIGCSGLPHMQAFGTVPVVGELRMLHLMHLLDHDAVSTDELLMNDTRLQTVVLWTLSAFSRRPNEQNLPSDLQSFPS